MNNIKQVRLSKNITQKQLAEAIGVDHTVISKFEKGITSPSVSRLEQIAKVLDVRVDTLLTGEEDESMPAAVRRRAGFKASSIEDDKYFVSESTLARSLIAHSKGICELCEQEAPFKDLDGMPFLESHFVKWLSLGGSPTIDNMVVLCPNCHRKVHTLNDPEDLQKLQNVLLSRGKIEIL